MGRKNNWSKLLADCIVEAQQKHFKYGQFDCALFAADCVNAMTGIDYAAELRGYESKIDAYRIVTQYGSLEAMITSLLGKQPIQAHYAAPGDVVLALPALGEGETGEAIGICLGVKFAAPQSQGLSYRPMSECRIAWRVE